MLSLVIVLLCSGLLASGAFVAASAAAGHYLGVQITKVQIGLFPIFSRGRLNVGLIPFGGYTRFADSRDDADPADDPDLFDRKPRGVRVAIYLSGVVGMLLLAFVLRGIESWHSFVHGFRQLAEGTLAPIERGADLLKGFARLLEVEGPLVAVSVFAAKSAAVNLLAIPFFAGGQALLELLGITGRGPAAERRYKFLSEVGLCLLFGIGCLWVRAFVEAMKR